MKRLFLNIAQAAVTLFLLWWIFHDPSKRDQMASALQRANYFWILPGVLAVGGAYLLQTERWRLLLEVQDIHMGWWRTWRLTMMGVFFNLFLLGSTGGDLLKIYYAMKETSSNKSAALLSVVVDRVIGMIALLVVTIVVCFFRLPELMAKPDIRALLGIVAAIFAALIGFVGAGFAVDRVHLAHRLPHWLPFRAKISELSTAFSIYARKPRVLAAAFGLSIPAHLLTFLSFYFAARAFGAFTGAGGILDVSTVVPLIQTITALPISFSGIGLREGLFQRIFAELFSTQESVSVMISITGFVMVVAWGLLGGLIYLLYRPSDGMSLGEITREVAAADNALKQ